MRNFSDFNKLKVAIGTGLGASDWMEAAHERINLLAQATCDEQWIQVDHERAKRERSGGITVAHGTRPLGLAPMFIRFRNGPQKPAQYLEWADRIRYLPRPGRHTDQGPHQHREVEDVPDGVRVNYQW